MSKHATARHQSLLGRSAKGADTHSHGGQTDGNRRCASGTCRSAVCSPSEFASRKGSRFRPVRRPMELRRRLRGRPPPSKPISLPVTLVVAAAAAAQESRRYANFYFGKDEEKQSSPLQIFFLFFLLLCFFIFCCCCCCSLLLSLFCSSPSSSITTALGEALAHHQLSHSHSY